MATIATRPADRSKRLNTQDKDDSGDEKRKKRQRPNKEHNKPPAEKPKKDKKKRCDRCRIEQRVCDFEEGKKDPCWMCANAGASACMFNDDTKNYVGVKKDAMETRLRQSFDDLVHIYLARGRTEIVGRLREALAEAERLRGAGQEGGGDEAEGIGNAEQEDGENGEEDDNGEENAKGGNDSDEADEEEQVGGLDDEEKAVKMEVESP